MTAALPSYLHRFVTPYLISLVQRAGKLQVAVSLQGLLLQSLKCWTTDQIGLKSPSAETGPSRRSTRSFLGTAERPSQTLTVARDIATSGPDFWLPRPTVHQAGRSCRIIPVSPCHAAMDVKASCSQTIRMTGKRWSAGEADRGAMPPCVLAP